MKAKPPVYKLAFLIYKAFMRLFLDFCDPCYEAGMVKSETVANSNSLSLKEVNTIFFI